MDDTAGIYARESEYLERYVQIGVAQSRVLSVEFPTEPAAEAATDHELLDRVEAYLGGEVDEFDGVTVAMTMPTAQRTVFEKVREIPYGENATLTQVMHMVPGKNPEDDDDRREVRAALGENPVPIFIPTHRVEESVGGDLSGVRSKLRALEGL